MTETPNALRAATAEAAALFAAGRFAEAAGEFQKALAEAPGSADLYYNLGTVLAADGRHPEAVAAFRAALGLRPQDAATLNNLGNSLMALGCHEEAESSFAQALKYDRRNRTIIGNRAGNLSLLAAGRRENGREGEALAPLELAVALDPDNAEAWNNLATVLHDLRRLDHSERAFGRALALRPDYPLALGNLANLRLDRGDVDGALALYERAVALAPESPIAHWNLALALLLTGELRRGFAEFEWRTALPQAAALYPPRPVPLWRGEPLGGRRILIHAEQGLGDSLQFVRYASPLARLGAEVWLECQPPLKRLLATVDGVAGVVVPGEAAPAADFVCPLMSLPHRLGTTLDDVPAAIPYLRVDPERLAAWRSRLPAADRRPRVGIVWAGEPRNDQPDANRIDRRRSLHIGELEPLLEVEGIAWFSLQKGKAAGQLPESRWAGRVVDWSADFSDFVETGALVSQLDLVIGVDTSVIHLAAALGRPTWVLSRFDGCWRWLLGRDDSPWYPGLRLFRQERPLDWQPVVAALARALADWRDGFGEGRHG